MMKTFSIAAGIVMWAATTAANASAQPILNRVEQFVREQINAATQVAQPAEPGYLGLIGDDAADAGRGVRVLQVVPGQAAAQGGLETGDLITKIGDQPIRGMDDMARALEGKTAGTKLSITVERNGTTNSHDVTLGRRESAPANAAQDASSAPRPRLGVRSIPVTEVVGRQNGLPAPRGAHVISVIKDSPAERAGIPLGAIITAVGAAPVNTPEDLAAAVRGAQTNQMALTYVYRGRPAQASIMLADPTPEGAGGRQVRARPPLPPGPADARPEDAAEPVVENPALEQDTRVEALERRLEQLEARIKSLEADRAPRESIPAAKPPE